MQSSHIPGTRKVLKNHFRATNGVVIYGYKSKELLRVRARTRSEDVISVDNQGRQATPNFL